MTRCPTALSGYGIVYALADPRTKEVRYIGQTSKSIEDRLRSHKSAAKVRSSHVACWLMNLMEEGLEPEVRILSRPPLAFLDMTEIWWIGEMKRSGADLTNIAPGGHTHRGESSWRAKLTEAQVIEIRLRAASGASYSELRKEFNFQGIADVVKGRSWTHVGGPIQTGHKPFSNRGRQFSPESKRAMAEAQRKLSPVNEQDVMAIREAWAVGIDAPTLANQYGLSTTGVLQIAHGVTWTHLPFVERSVEVADEAERRRKAVSSASIAVVTEDQVMDLRKRYAEGTMSIGELALATGISKPTVGAIVRGVTWRHLPVPKRPPELVAEARRLKRESDTAKRSSLTDERVMHLRTRYANEPITIAALAEEEGLTSGTLTPIVLGINWKHLPTLERSPEIAAQAKSRRRIAMRGKGTSLTAEEVMRLRKLHAESGMSIAEFARSQDMNPKSLGSIIRGATWSWLPVLYEPRPKEAA